MVFTDINLGGPVTGLDVAERFRSEQPDMPVVYMSGQAMNRARLVLPVACSSPSRIDTSTF